MYKKNNMNTINLYFEYLFTLSNSNWEIFNSKLKSLLFSEKKIVLDFEKNEKHLTLLKNRIIRKYFPAESAYKEFEIVFEGKFASAYDFYITKKKSIYIIETISPSEFICISYSDLQSHYNLTSNENNTVRKASKETPFKKSKLEIALICL